jgi:hypothetical protein
MMAKTAKFPIGESHRTERGDVSVLLTQQVVYSIDQLTYRQIVFKVCRHGDMNPEWTFVWQGAGDDITGTIQLNHLDCLAQMPDPEYSRLILLLDKLFREIGEQGE